MRTEASKERSTLMKIRKIFVFAASLTVAGMAWAGENKSMADKVKMLDTDADGRVSAAEYTAKDGKTMADFAKVDQDGDGFASAVELETHWGQDKTKKGSADQPATTPPTPPTGAATTRPVDD